MCPGKFHALNFHVATPRGFILVGGRSTFRALASTARVPEALASFHTGEDATRRLALSNKAMRLCPIEMWLEVKSTILRKRWCFTRICLALAVTICASAQGMKDFGNRFEGTNVHANALEDFTLLAIHRNFKPVPRNANLNVRFFLPQLPDSPKREVFVEAAELQDSFHYFMRSKGSIQWKDGDWNVFRPWPTKDVIDQLDLNTENLGVLAGYRIAGNLPVYLPVDVYQDDGQLAKHTYTFFFATGKDLQSLEIFVTNVAGTEMNLHKPELKCSKTFNPNCKLFAAGSTQAFDLDMSLLPEGEYHLKLVGHVPRASKPTSLDFTLYHRSYRIDHP